MSESRILRCFGVSQSAEMVYRTMLDHPATGVAGLAARLRITEQVVQGALDELAELALLRPSWESPDLLRPVSPEIGLESLLARQQAELLQRQNQLDESRAALAAMVAERLDRHQSTVSHTEFEDIVGLDAVRDRLEQLTHGTRHEVVTFAPGGAQSAEALQASKPLDRHLRDQGVDIRTIYLDSVRNDPASVHYARWLAELGGQVRTVPVLPLRMIVVDRSVAVVPLDPVRSRAGVTQLRHLGVVAALHALFEQVWQVASPLGNRERRHEHELSRQEHVLLGLLAQGDTDDVVARKLGVSVRTVRRIASELMVQLGARSRFQAGVRVAMSGWLPTS
jgi:DNA-binding CsgD family transcriptional regulator/sugar-specific transcriptional regulator TrmB